MKDKVIGNKSTVSLRLPRCNNMKKKIFLTLFIFVHFILRYQSLVLEWLGGSMPLKVDTLMGMFPSSKGLTSTNVEGPWLHQI